jgi:hypothetical protein
LSGGFSVFLVVEIVERRFPLGACGRIVFLVVEFAVDGVAFLAAFVDSSSRHIR